MGGWNDLGLRPRTLIVDHILVSNLMFLLSFICSNVATPTISLPQFLPMRAMTSLEKFRYENMKMNRKRLHFSNLAHFEFAAKFLISFIATKLNFSSGTWSLSMRSILEEAEEANKQINFPPPNQKIKKGNCLLWECCN